MDHGQRSDAYAPRLQIFIESSGALVSKRGMTSDFSDSIGHIKRHVRSINVLLTLYFGTVHRN
jgi:hypothetical protein